MSYIANVSGSDVVELRVGTLIDIPEVDRDNWRAVIETGDIATDPMAEVKVISALTLAEPNVQMVWTKTVLPPAYVKMRLKDYAAQKRWQHSQSGLTLPNGVVIDTTDASKSKINQTFGVLERGWIATVDWKAKTGKVTLDLAGITAIAQAVAAFEQACFAAEFAIIDAVDAGTITTKADIDGYAWP